MNQISSKPAHAPSELVTLDCDSVFTHAGGDPKVLVQLCMRFLGELPPCMQAMQRTIAQCKHPAADRAAQDLRNCLMVFGSGAASQTADALDAAVRCGRTREARQHWKILQEQLQSLLPQVQQLMLQLSNPRSAVQ